MIILNLSTPEYEIVRIPEGLPVQSSLEIQKDELLNLVGAEGEVVQPDGVRAEQEPVGCQLDYESMNAD